MAPVLSPLATDNKFRYEQQMRTGFEGLPAYGGPAGQMIMQHFGGQFMAGANMLPLGLSEQNVMDRIQGLRYQQMHDSFLQEASKRDERTYYEGLRGFARLTDTPWASPQIHAAQNLAGGMAAFGPIGLQLLGPQVMDQLGGMRGLNVVMADQMSRGSRFRIDPTTGRTGLGKESLESLNSQVFEAMFAGNAWRSKSAGLSAGEAGMLFNEMSQMGMMGGGARMEDLLMQIQGTPTGAGVPKITDSTKDLLVDRAVALGIDMGGGVGHDPRVDGKTPRFDNLSAGDLTRLREDSAVSGAVQTFDNSKAKATLENYAGILKAMREIFGDAGRPNAPIPELINSLNQLTGGALPQLSPGEVENMARETMNLAKSTGLGLEATMMLSEASMMQAQELGLPPIFGADALQHGLAFRGAYQGLGIGSQTAWGKSGQDALMLKSMELTNSAAASRMSNQMGAALRLRDLSPDAFAAGSEAAAYVAAAAAGADFYGPDSKPLNMDRAAYTQMLEAGTGGRLDQATIHRLLSQSSLNLEKVHQYGIQHTTRRAQRPAAIKYVAQETQFNISEALGGADVAGVGAKASRALGGSMAQATTQRMFDLTNAQNADPEAERDAIIESMGTRLHDIADGKIVVAGVTRAQAQAMADRFDADPKFQREMAIDYAGGFEQAAQSQNNHFTRQSGQDLRVEMSTAMMNRIARNQAASKSQRMQQQAMSSMGRSGLLRRSMQALIDATDTDNLQTIVGDIIGGEPEDKIAERLDGDDGLLAKLRANAKQAKAHALLYEQATSPEARAAAFETFAESNKAWESSVQELSNTARRLGLNVGGLVDKDDVTRALRATTEVDDLTDQAKAKAGWIDNEKNRKNLETAVRIQRSRDDDMVAKFYSEPSVLARLGAPGTATLKQFTDAQTSLDALAGEYFDGDTAAMLATKTRPAGMGQTAWNTLQVDRKLMRMGRSRLAELMGGTNADDYGYLSQRDDIRAMIPAFAATKTYKDVVTVGDVMELGEEDYKSLLNKGLDQDQINTLIKAKVDYDAFQDKTTKQKENYFKKGSDILKEGLARSLLGTDATDKDIEAEAEDVTEQRLVEFYGSPEDYKTISAAAGWQGPEGRAARAVIEDMLEDVKGDGIGIDKDTRQKLLEFAERVNEELDPDNQEPQEMVITGTLDLKNGEIKGKGVTPPGKGQG